MNPNPKVTRTSMRNSCIRLSDLEDGDIILVLYRLNAKKAPYMPFRISSTTPIKNKNGWDILPGVVLLADRQVTIDENTYSCATRVQEINGELYALGTLFTTAWLNRQYNDALVAQNVAEQKLNWIRNLSARNPL